MTVWLKVAICGCCWRRSRQALRGRDGVDERGVGVRGARLHLELHEPREARRVIRDGLCAKQLP